MRTISTLTLFIALLLFGCGQISNENHATATATFETDTLTAPKEPVERSYPEDHEGEWLLTSKLFDSLLTFKRIEISDSLIVYGKKFTFNGEDLKFEHFNPVPACGNGMFYMDSCAYQMENKNFTFFFKGGHTFESNFLYSAEYMLKTKNDKQISFVKTATLIDHQASIYEEVEKMNKSL